MKRDEVPQQLKILLISDCETDQQLIRQLSSNVCCTITEQQSPEDGKALAIANPEAFDVILVNHSPPTLDGLKVCRELLDEHLPLPLVFMTDCGNEKAASEALISGVTAHIIKAQHNAYAELLPATLSRAVENYRVRCRQESAVECLIENQDRLLHILEGITIPTFVIDNNHIVTYWNQACANITKVPASEVIGTRQQWRAFYACERPVMADLIVDDVIEDMVMRHYGGKFQRSKIIEGAFEAEDFFPHFGDAGKWVYFTAAPLKDSDGKRIGAIETLQDVSDRRKAELALKESERLYRELSITDGLTRLYNSRHFFGRAREEVERSNRYSSPLSLILLDVDNFKAFNDTYGHIDGDRILAGLAEVIKEGIRGVDSAYRYGGEEFIVLFPETEQEEAYIVAERIRHTFEQTTFSPKDGISIRMTISIGGGSYHQGEDLTSFVKRIDSAMYEAKKRGKNRVLFID